MGVAFVEGEEDEAGHVHYSLYGLVSLWRKRNVGEGTRAVVPMIAIPSGSEEKGSWVL